MIVWRQSRARLPNFADLLGLQSGFVWQGLMGLLVLLGMIVSENVSAAEQISLPLENHMLGIEIGSTVDELTSLHPDLRPRLAESGGTEYEACNRKKAHLFSFLEGSKKPGVISAISVIRVWTERCTSEYGLLPDLILPPVSARGVKLGDSMSVLLEKYGEPQRTLDMGLVQVMEYRDDSVSAKDQVVLMFVVTDGQIGKITLSLEKLPQASR